LDSEPASPAIRIVLVDDNIGFQRAIAGHLAAQTYLSLIGVAASGQEVLALPSTLAPQIVLLDIHLPDQSGLRLIEPLLRKWPGSKIIMLTFDDYPRMRQAALKAGATDFISKVNAPDELVPAIHRAMNDSHGGSAP
jgi:DNA-binding NarL/FixJ family response regulator